MQLTQDYGHGQYQIRSYEPGKIIINEQTYTQSLIVTFTTLIHPWRPQTLSELKPEDFAIVLEQDPEVFLLGTGKQLVFPASQLFENFNAKQIGVEVMDTAAACRTFNVLCAEDRRVVAALLL